MSDYELQMDVLQKYYENRRKISNVILDPNSFPFEINDEEIKRISLLLDEQNLINAATTKSASGYIYFLGGMINSSGIKVIEQKSLTGEIPVINNYNIDNSNGIQIGNGNNMSFTYNYDIEFNELISKIEKSEESPEKKSKAIELLKKGVAYLGKEGTKAMISNFMKNMDMNLIITTLQTILPS